jgi:UDP-N-acetylmuramate dehydrogenase
MDSLHGCKYNSRVFTLRDFLEKINIGSEVTWEEPMSRHTTFGIGGPAEAFVRPTGPDSALRLLGAARREGVPLFVLGGGANLLVGDKGIRGIVLDASALRWAREEGGEGGERLLVAGAGLSVDELCLEALARGLGGLEDFFGMPGSVGGAVYMNARCYEREIADLLAWALSAPGTGDSGVLGAPDGAAARRLEASGRVGGGWDYKRSPYQPGGAAAGELLLEAAFRVRALDDEGAARCAAAMRGRRADREAKGHYRLPSAGSMFKNDRAIGVPTGKLLDGLGMRGRRIGDAMVSEWHANIFVNAGRATAADMRALVELARAEAKEKLGVELEPEVLMAGEF